VCKDYVPPITAYSAYRVVLMILLYGSCYVSDHPEVCQCVLNFKEFSLLGLNLVLTKYAHSFLAALNLAIYM